MCNEIKFITLNEFILYVCERDKKTHTHKHTYNAIGVMRKHQWNVVWNRKMLRIQVYTNRMRYIRSMYCRLKKRLKCIAKLSANKLTDHRWERERVEKLNAEQWCKVAEWASVDLRHLTHCRHQHIFVDGHEYILTVAIQVKSHFPRWLQGMRLKW